MKFEELDRKMRLYEQSLDQFIAPEMYFAARLDGRSFTRLTKEVCPFEAPFDVSFRDMMVNTVKQLMDCGFRVVYGYTQSDEISLLFHRDECTFGRKERKYNSILAGQASTAFSLQLGMPAVFDCRLIPLPDKETVRDYFLWRQEDAHRNSLNAHCYWLLRKEGLSPQNATSLLSGRSMDYKEELLLSRGINYEYLPLWQRRGIGLCWTEFEKRGFNPISGEESVTTRRGLQVDYTLPAAQDYASFIDSLSD